MLQRDNRTKEKKIILGFLFLILIFLMSCMKRNISSAVGGGAGFPPQSGITRLRFSPGNFDENVRPAIDFYGIYRLEKKDIVPSTGFGIFFEFLEIRDTIFPMFGSSFNLMYLYNREQKKWEITTEFLLSIYVESVINQNFSIFYELPVNLLRSGYIFPKFSLIFGGIFYLERWGK